MTFLFWVVAKYISFVKLESIQQSLLDDKFLDLSTVRHFAKVGSAVVVTSGLIAAAAAVVAALRLSFASSPN